MVESFTNYQRCMWLTLANCGVCRYFVNVTSQGKYVIQRHASGNLLFWMLWTNTFSKFVYHSLSYRGLLGVEVHFLDQMSIIDWLLMYWHVFIECLVWYFKYPMWENLYRQWELQEEIYRKLGRPENAAKKIMRTDRINFVVYGGVCLVGTFALAVQFFFTPKYALNTYALLESDTMLLRIIFCIHECLFMCHGYAYQAFTMVLAESYSVSYQHLLEEMNKCLAAILSQSKTLFQNSQPVSKTNPTLLMGPVASKSKAPGTDYTIPELLNDYKKIMISAQFHNQWIGAVMGFPEAINYAQFVSDVFMMIQLLKEPETDLWGVCFYIMDAVFGMIMIFRMIIILSRLYPQSEEFIQGLKVHAMGLNGSTRKELVKTISALRIVSAKLTGYSVKPQSVPIGINTLIQCYITAALWKRPEDASRRT